MKRISAALFFITVLLAFLGLFLLYESSSYTALQNIGDKYFYVKRQLVWVLVGIFLSLTISKISYKKLYNFALPLLAVSLLFLLLVFVPGLGLKLKGAYRWIDFRLFVFQPSELLKVSLVLYLAAWFANKEKGRIIAFLLLFFTCILLVVLEPDMGTALIVALTSLLIYFLSGTRVVEVIFVLALLFGVSFLLVKIEPYRVARFLSFANFDYKSFEDTSYHIKQVLIAFGYGGLSGVGFGKSIQKYAYVPESTTDSIFAIFAEEAGFLGSAVLLLIFLSQVFFGFLIALKTNDKFGRLLACGLIVFLGIQTLMNLASQAVMIPLTGVPLPFISYGGSSMIINFISIGIILNIGNSIQNA